MEKGRIVLDGISEQLKENEHVKEFYLILMPFPNGKAIEMSSTTRGARDG